MIFRLKPNSRHKLLSAAIVTGALLISGCAAHKAPVITDMEKDKAEISEFEKQMKAPVIRIDNEDFTRVNIENAINNLMPQSSMHGSISDEKYKRIKKQAMNTLYEDTIIYNHSEAKDKTAATEQELEAELDRVKKNVPEGETLDSTLERSHMTLKQLKEIISKNIVTNKLKKIKSEEIRTQGDNIVNEDFLKAYYDKNTEKFVTPEQILLSEILIRVDPSGGDAALNAGYEKIQDIRKLIKEGRDFSKLAIEHSQDPYAKKGGDMGWSHRESLLEEIDLAARQLKKGETSKPVRTIYGYHIIKLVDTKPSTQLKFSEINKEKLREDLLKKEYKRLHREWLEALGKKARVEILHDDYKGFIDQ